MGKMECDVTGKHETSDGSTELSGLCLSQQKAGGAWVVSWETTVEKKQKTKHGPSVTHLCGPTILWTRVTASTTQTTNNFATWLKVDRYSWRCIVK